MAKNNKMPAIRFSGYTDTWEQCKLGEIFEYLQNNTLSRDSLNYKNPNIKNIHYGDILVKFDEILDGSNKDIPYINSELDLSKFSNHYFEMEISSFRIQLKMILLVKQLSCRM